MKNEKFSYFNFAGIKNNYKNCKCVILPIPYEVTTSYKKGTFNAPLSIINASQYLELYDNELEAEIYKVGIYTFAELELQLKNYETAIRQIRKQVKKIIEDDKFIVIIGGEHTITIGIVQALINKYQDLQVLQFDAHPDLRDTYYGTKYSHACVTRRIKEYTDCLQIGIRSLSKEEKNYIENNCKDKVFYIEDVKKKNFYNKLEKLLTNNIYLTIDVDIFDPAIIPSVTTPEPSGIGYEEFLNILKFLFKNRNIVGVDLVEFSPIPNIVYPEYTVAKLIYKIIGYKFFLSVNVKF